MKNILTATIYFMGILCVSLFTVKADGKTTEYQYRYYCASCHSAGVVGRIGEGKSDEQVAAIIRSGLPDKGMPSFGTVLSDHEIHALANTVRARSGRDMVGVTIEAETLNRQRSADYYLAEAETYPDLHYIGYFDFGSSLCYDNIDLTGVQSIEFEYARGEGGEGRFAILVSDPNGFGQRSNIGESEAKSTDGWETFKRHRVGLSRQLSGLHSLCLFGVDGGGIFNLDKFTLSDQSGENDGVTLTFDTAVPSVFSSAGHKFRVEKVVEAGAELWDMAFLPDGTILTTQKNGQLLLLENDGQLVVVEDTPQIWNRGHGGLLGVHPHPDYTNNGWLYLTYSDTGKDGTTMTGVARGKLAGRRWVNRQIIYTAPEKFHTGSHVHFGSRLVFHGDYIYFGIGDRGNPKHAQDLTQPAGKIHRLYANGKVPKDNPFVKNKKALSTIWSYGHRNPQGMTIHPHNGSIWSAEHGPRGGDELNQVRKGLNYGWPLVSFGINYDGTAISASPYKEGIEPPVHHWTPSIAVSQIEFYTGNRFPGWRNRLIVASLGSQQLRLVRLDGNKVISDEQLFQGLGRIRDVSNGPDGYPYAILNHPNGVIYRLMPADETEARN
jgi:glucose/arabinose dehydrogenase